MERHEYAEAAHLLEAVQQLSSHFQSYVHIPKVRCKDAHSTSYSDVKLDLNSMAVLGHKAVCIEMEPFSVLGSQDNCRLAKSRVVLPNWSAPCM